MSHPAPGRYESLDPQRVIETVERLALRIEERFPGSGLAAVCRHPLSVARQIQERSEWVARPVWGLRIGATLVWVLEPSVAPAGLVESGAVLPAAYAAGYWLSPLARLGGWGWRDVGGDWEVRSSE
ncbi:MAG: hypothetical protein KJZ87_11430 [Thermoguttaceae bacterium]|nr:hypothetical protein [Thermoguttaceae bacterium]